MTNHKNTKRALFASVISLLLCVSMLIGSTFAWFTDTATTGVNRITSGNLDMKVSWYDGTKWEEVSETTKLFKEAARWEPGYTEVAYLKVENAGSLAFKYQLAINVANEVKGTSVTNEEIALSKILKFDAIEINADAFYADRTKAVDAVKATAGNLATKKISDQLEVGDPNPAKYYALVVYMPEDVGNEANHNGTDVPSITFGVNVNATQLASESDSFNNKYDEGALYSDSSVIKDGAMTTLSTATTTVTIPAGVLTAGQVVKLSTESTTAPETLVTVDDTLITAKDISIVDADGNVVTMPEGEYSVTMDIGKNLDKTKLALYHKEAEITEFTYDAATGIISFTTNSFSPFTVIYENVGTIDSAEKLVAVRDSINAGDTKAGVVYNLAKDIDLAGVEWTAIKDFAGTFDGQGHTIFNMTANLFYTVSGTVKNLNVEKVTVNHTGKANDKGSANAFIGTVAEGGLVDNCKVSDVTITWPDTLKDACDCYGGIINRVNTGATVQNCEFSNITMTAHGYVKRSSPVFAEVSGKISGCTVDGVELNVVMEDKGTSTAYANQVGGVIADLYSGAEVSNCNFKNITITADRANANVGGIIGKAYVTGIEGTHEITLKNITVNGLTMKIGNTITTKVAVSNVGGFIGQVDSRNNDAHLTMDNCHINGLDMTLLSKTKGEDPSGGLISSLNGGADISNCSVDGKINGANTVMGIGGFLGEIGGYGANNLEGQANAGKTYIVNITGCSADVAITGNDKISVGGFVSYAGCASYNIALELTFTNCEATGSFYGQLETGTNEVTTFTGCKVNGAAFND